MSTDTENSIALDGATMEERMHGGLSILLGLIACMLRALILLANFVS